VFGIARVVLDVYGPDLTAGLGVGIALAAVAALTLVVASVIALRQDNLKRRLAFSTVSQLSYIVLGLAVLNPWSLVGGLLHIPAHAFMKLTLFFCAGALHVETHTDDISDMAGIGRRMPLTMTAFGVASLGMAGIPLVAGFVSKYFLLIGTISTGDVVFTVALLVSGVLNVAYFWPVVYTAFFESPGTADGKPLVENALGGWFGDREAATDGGETPTDDRSIDGRARADVARDDRGYAETHGGQGALDGSETAADVGIDDGHGGSPAWERRRWNGQESTWFVLGPILFAMAGSIVLGIVPDGAVFLQIVRLIVENVTGVAV
jgi:NADH:ubiquinone oxidoreductase subunit 5 (subunit L)/multisubunit Na+/H+ antiporter MnhA subunit